MKRRALLYVVLFTLLGCIESIGRPTPARENSPAEDEKCGCLVVGLQGRVYVTPENSAKDLALKPNMAVFTGDLIKVYESSKVRLICDEMYKEQEFTSGIHAVPCKPSDNIIRVGDRMSRLVDPSRVRGTPDPSFPRLLSPRKTVLLDAHPRLRWTPVGNATAYTVRVLRGPKVEWSKTVTSTETVYPNNAPALVPGQQYRATILAGRRSSDDENVLGLEFTIMETEKAQQVRARENEIRKLNLDETSKRLLIAYLYAGHGLDAEAIMQLDEASNDLEVVRLLAELYLRIMLTDKAEAQYLRAIGLSNKDPLGQAVVYDRLGQIYTAQGKKDQAIEKYENALKSFMELKNWNMVREIAERLTGLAKR